MKTLCIISEGSTECNFIKNVLAEHLLQYDWFVWPITLITGKNNAGVHKGGWRSSDGYKEALKQIKNTITSRKDAAMFTTFFDLYGFPSDIPCFYESKRLSSPYDKARLYEKQIKRDVSAFLDDSSRFIPYVQPYEFECFLFVEPSKSASRLTNDQNRCNELEQKLTQIAAQFETPEHINNSRETAPSKRIESLVPGFDKNKAGRAGFSWAIAKEAGIESIRKKCTHFGQWLDMLEGK